MGVGVEGGEAGRMATTLATHESYLGSSTSVCRAGGVHTQSWLSLSLGDRIVGDVSTFSSAFSEGVCSTTIYGKPPINLFCCL